MDRSVDSIGSCSLDVDADSSDISDTSGSLNFPTPLSIKDVTREFTANIRERCSVRTVQNTTALLDPATGQVRMVLTQPTAIVTTNGAVNAIATTGAAATTTFVPTQSSCGAAKESSALPLTPADAQPDKKPSYLNLACCVNGYSNLTTYDSKIRQDINKSREVSPIRPSSQSLQYCKRNNALAPPVLLTMPNVSVANGCPAPPHTKQPTATGHKYGELNNNNNNSHSIMNASNRPNYQENGNNGSCMSDGNDDRRHTSFIQQRVERLYGPGALAQGFYSPKKTRSHQGMRIASNAIDADAAATTELSRKFQELTPGKDYSQFRKKLDTNSAPIPAHQVEKSMAAIEHSLNNSIDLPVLRHLSQEFRAQLPTISPKRTFARSSPSRDANANPSPKAENATKAHAKVQNGSTPRPALPAHSPAQVQQLSEVHAQALQSVTRQLPVMDEVDHKAFVAPALSEVRVPATVSVSAKALDSKPLNTNTQQAEDSNSASLAAQNSIGYAGNSIDDLPQEDTASPSNGSLKKDGNYFLRLLRGEQTRLLALASDGEKYLEALTTNPEISEDTLGFLRAASGKARLLVSQKMKQFEGLCHNNLNRSPEDKFPTTVDDLQGFWDMVYLQIDHIDSIFKEIEVLKSNDWKKPIEAVTNDASGFAVYSTTANAAPTRRTQNPTKTGNNIKSTKTVHANSSKSQQSMSAAALKREAQRKKLLEMKRKNRLALLTGATTVSVAVAEVDTGAGAGTHVDNAAASNTANNANSNELFAGEMS